MNIQLKCFSTLASDYDCSSDEATAHDVVEGKTLGKFLAEAGIPGDRVKIAFVNNRSAGMGTVLTDGDRVGLAPATGGM